MNYVAMLSITDALANVIANMTQGITDWIRNILIESIQGWLIVMFADSGSLAGTGLVSNLSVSVDLIKALPESWNTSIFNIIRTMTETAIMPVAALILAYVIAYDLIQMVIDKNSMHDIDTFMFFKWALKTYILILICTNAFTIANAIFEVGADLVNQGAQAISTSVVLSPDLTAGLDNMSIGELLIMFLQTVFAFLLLLLLSLGILIVSYGRLIEIYLYLSVAPIPLATLGNREWGQVGTNYIRALIALALQGFLMIVCYGIYAGLISSLTNIISIIMCTAVLFFTLLKTGSISKSILNAH